MAMTVGSRQRDPEVMIDINTTPLIDVMLVLIIMLIITIPIQTHAVKLNMPAGTPPPPITPPQVITIDIDFDGTLIWNGETLSSWPDLKDHLSGARDNAHRTPVWGRASSARPPGSPARPPSPHRRWRLLLALPRRRRRSAARCSAAPPGSIT